MNKLLLPVAGALLAGGLLVPVGAQASTTTPECTAGALAVSFHATGAGMSHEYGSIRLRNVSASTCVVQGYGGLSYVGPHGHRVGPAAGRTPSSTPRIVLEPGQRAHSAVEMTSTGPYDKATCGPRTVVGLRVYAPDETHSRVARFAHPIEACSRVRTLWHKAYHAG